MHAYMSHFIGLVGEKIVERVHNSWKRSSDGQPDEHRAKRGRPKIYKILDRYPPYTSDFEPGESGVDHKQEMKDELAGSNRKDVIIPHLRLHLPVEGILYFPMRKAMDLITSLLITQH